MKSVPEPELTEQDEADLHDLYAEQDGGPSFHPILQVWREVLKPAATEKLKPVTPIYAVRMIQSHPEITYAVVPELQRRYFDKILELADILDGEIASDPECLTYTTPEDDAERNAEHYKNLLLLWQLSILRWEQEWDATDEHAAAEVAAMAETHKMFLGEQGIVAFLDQIKFEYTEADQAQMAEALTEFRLGAEGAEDE